MSLVSNTILRLYTLSAAFAIMQPNGHSVSTHFNALRDQPPVSGPIIGYGANLDIRLQITLFGMFYQTVILYVIGNSQTHGISRILTMSHVVVEVSVRFGIFTHPGFYIKVFSNDTADNKTKNNGSLFHVLNWQVDQTGTPGLR